MEESLVARLKASARQISEFTKRDAEDRAARLGGVYAWVKPEDTLHGQAAARIEALELDTVAEGFLDVLLDGNTLTTVPVDPVARRSGRATKAAKRIEALEAELGCWQRIAAIRSQREDWVLEQWGALVAALSALSPSEENR